MGEVRHFVVQHNTTQLKSPWTSRQIHLSRFLSSNSLSKCNLRVFRLLRPRTAYTCWLVCRRQPSSSVTSLSWRVVVRYDDVLLETDQELTFTCYMRQPGATYNWHAWMVAHDNVYDDNCLFLYLCSSSCSFADLIAGDVLKRIPVYKIS